VTSTPSSHVVRGATPGIRRRIVAYKDLAKLTEWGAFLSVPLVWSLLDSHHWTAPRTFAILLLSLATQAGVRTAESALDDVAGVRDGIDVVNYAEASPHRARGRKPLLDMRLTEAQARRYAYTAAATGVVAFVIAFAVAGFAPFWAPLTAAFAATLVVTYSWGPKLSYHGGQELIVISGVAVSVITTFGLIEHSLTWPPVIEGLIMGIWLMQPVTFANMHDLDGDRQAGRQTMAVRLSAAANRRYILALFGLAWTIFVAALATGQLRWWFVLCLVPCMAIQSRALRAGVWGENFLLARRACHLAYRIGFVGFFCANLIQFH